MPQTETLNWLRNFKNPEGQLARWLEILGTYKFTIKHRAGLKHLNSNGLSRRPCSDCKHCTKRETTEDKLSRDNHAIRAIDAICNTYTEPSELSVNWFDSKSHAELRDAQHNDPISKQVIKWIEHGNKPEWADISHLSQTLEIYWSQFDRLVLTDEVLYRNGY